MVMQCAIFIGPVEPVPVNVEPACLQEFHPGQVELVLTIVDSFDFESQQPEKEVTDRGLS